MESGYSTTSPLVKKLADNGTKATESESQVSTKGSVETLSAAKKDSGTQFTNHDNRQLVDSGRESLDSNSSELLPRPRAASDLPEAGVRPLLERSSSLINHDIQLAKHHKQLIERLRSDGFITSDKVYEAMLSVPFSNFGWSYSYTDASYIANELENCANIVREGQHVLVISSWYYLYVPLCLSLMVGPKGQVTAHGDEGRESVRKDHAHILDDKRLVLVSYDWDAFKTEGFALKAPYDVILVCEKYFSAEIKEQLRSPGGLAFDQVNNKIVYAVGADDAMDGTVLDGTEVVK